MAWKYDKDKITYFAETDFRGQRVKFGIREEDRARHMYIIGKTGMGKSTLLENLAIQDIQNDEGMCFIDPHGGTAEALLAYVPEHRIKDVVYFAPHEMEWPVALNVLENDDPNKRPLIASGILSTFKKVWPDAWSGRMEYFLMNTLLALLETPGSTLLGVNRMYSDAEYREKIIANVKDTSVRAFWVDEYANMTEKMVAEATPAIQNKVGQFSMNPIMRNILGQSESTFDIRWLMDNRKIFIVNLSKGRVGETNAALLGALLVTKIYLAAMSRADLSDAEIKTAAPFHLYVDEFQNFANDSFANILSEARKYKLALTIAHQYIEQMPDEVRHAVFGNVGTMITFRIGAGDAEVLEKEFAPVFTMDDIVGLGFAQIYLKLMINGAASVPFSARTSDRPVMPTPSFAKEVVDASREQFSRPRAEVEEIIKEWFTTDTSKRGEGDGRPGAKKFAPGQRPSFGGGAGGARPPLRARTELPAQASGQAAEGQSLAAALSKAGVSSKQGTPSEPERSVGVEADEMPARAAPQRSPTAPQSPFARPLNTRPVAPRTTSFPSREVRSVQDVRGEANDIETEPTPTGGRDFSQAPPSSVAQPTGLPPVQAGYVAPQYPQQGYAPSQPVYAPPAYHAAPPYYPQAPMYPQPPYQAPGYHYPYPPPQYGFGQPQYYPQPYYAHPVPPPMYPQPAPFYQPYPPTIHYSQPPVAGVATPPAPVQPTSEPRPVLKAEEKRVEDVTRIASSPAVPREQRPERKEERRETRPQENLKREIRIEEKPREYEKAKSDKVVAKNPIAPREEKLFVKRNDGKGPSGEKLDALAAALAKLSSKPEEKSGEKLEEKSAVSAPVISAAEEASRMSSRPVPMKPQERSSEAPREVPLDVLKKVLE